MKLLISNQHGAILMALMPFLYGMLLAQPIWQHFFLLLAWCSIYLMSYPFLNLFKGKKSDLYLKWTAVYALSAFLFALPALVYNPKILWFGLPIGLLTLVSIYYVKQKNERAFFNDLNGILIFATAGMAAYYFPHHQFNLQIWQVALLPCLFFVGVTLYVKSVLRERKNPRYRKISWLFHSFSVLACLTLQRYAFALAFTLPFIRAIWLPHIKLSTKQVGLIEIIVSLWFFIFLLVGSF